VSMVEEYIAGQLRMPTIRTSVRGISGID
jgi:hypothetical protein